jgi:hypothetical protein
MRAHFGLPSVASDEPDADKWRKRSINVKFEMPYYTVSGIQVSGTMAELALSIVLVLPLVNILTAILLSLFVRACSLNHNPISLAG